MFQTKTVEKIKTHFDLEIFFPKTMPFKRECVKIWQIRTDHTQQHNTVHALCIYMYMVYEGVTALLHDSLRRCGNAFQPPRTITTRRSIPEELNLRVSVAEVTGL